MAKRGRKSAAELSVVAFPGMAGEGPAPPPSLTTAEQAVWTRVVASLPADWFSEASWPVLEQYCRHVVEARRLSELIHQATGDPELGIDAYDQLLRMRERETRALVSCATKMRITQQSTRSHRGNQAPGAVRKPWEK